MSVAAVFWGSVALLVIGFLAAAARRVMTARVVYAACLAASTVLFVIALRHLWFDDGWSYRMELPLGLPWIGARFSLDALTAFFLLVVNLGAAASSLYGLGYGVHERASHRVLPFYPAFLAGMNLVVLADDAFTFLFAWEFMSLSSWALVMAHHRERDNARAGYIYLVMASFGTLSLLLAFGLLAGADGGYAFEHIRARDPSPLLAGLSSYTAVPPSSCQI